MYDENNRILLFEFQTKRCTMKITELIFKPFEATRDALFYLNKIAFPSHQKKKQEL